MQLYGDSDSEIMICDANASLSGLPWSNLYGSLFLDNLYGKSRAEYN